LIQPLAVGSDVAHGWTLLEATAPTAEHFEYLFQHQGDPGQSLLVFVDRKVAGLRGYCSTSYYTVGYHSDPGARLAPSAQRLLDAVVRLVRANERAPQPPARPPAQAVATATSPTLYLVPGHLGDAMDLSRRALQILAQVPTIVVEQGTVEGARTLLETAGIDPATKRFVEIDVDPVTGRDRVELVRAIALRRESACLFGVAEGAPAFVDPGSGVIAEAVRLGMIVRAVGGPSALTLALMRLEENVQEFLFLGRLECPRDVERFAARAGGMPEVPLILFTDGRNGPAFLPALTDRITYARGWLLSDLTTDRELALAWAAGDAAPFERLREDARVVVVLLRECRGA
jgi:16S rRNA C1402 (ribose-2'-O) methylase RsmI